MMKPIHFQCEQLMSKSGVEIATLIADTELWKEFKGYRFLPGIRHAEYQLKTANMLGSRIKVLNMDGSTHVEEIYKWDPEKEIAMKFVDLSKPVSRLATHFNEKWTFLPQSNGTLVRREMYLHPKSIFTRPILALIGRVLKKAIQQHLEEIAQAPSA
jgi:hypothetical protein